MNIRNSGFERGDVSFWEVISGGTLAIESGETHRGSYSGKETVTAAAVAMGLRHEDFVEVSYGGLIQAGLWCKGVAGDVLYLKIEGYDSDSNIIANTTIKSVTMSGVWEQVESQYLVGAEERYIRVYIYTACALDAAIIYLDSMVVSEISIDRYVERAMEIADLSNKTASGDTSTDKYRLYGLRNYYAEIEVTSITGTTPTCDVTVCELDQYGNERVLGTFTQFNATTDQRVGIAPPIGLGMYVKYVMGGTVTDCDFKVSVIGVR